MLVRTNLHDALLQIRLKTEDRYVWIDALSIDQANAEERNRQVRMMGRIYKDAENVVVWLGSAKDDSDFAMEMFADPTRLSKKLDEFNGAQYTAILALCGRSYWRRAWIQQEIFLAKRLVVHCGSKCISDTNLYDAVGEMERHNHPLYGGIIKKRSVYNFMRRKTWAPQSSNTLAVWLLLGIRARLESSEPRDFIYAMLGISQDCQNGELLPDYKKPLMEVYLETLAFCPRHVQLPRPLANKLGLIFDETTERLISEFKQAT